VWGVCSVVCVGGVVFGCVCGVWCVGGWGGGVWVGGGWGGGGLWGGGGGEGGAGLQADVQKRYLLRQINPKTCARKVFSGNYFEDDWCLMEKTAGLATGQVENLKP